MDASAADLQELNPSLLRLTTPRTGEFELHVPAGTKEKSRRSGRNSCDKRVWWRYHKVQGSDTLASIARTYHTTAKAIAEANNLDDDSVAPDTRLIIPIAPGKYRETGSYARAITRYRVRKGDTVETVAENFAVPAKMVRGWNHLRGSSLRREGKCSYLHLPVTPAAGERQVAARHSSKPASRHARTQVASNSGLVHHKVKRGETLSSIANSYNTTVAALKRANRKVATLRPGMILAPCATRTRSRLVSSHKQANCSLPCWCDRDVTPTI